MIKLNSNKGVTLAILIVVIVVVIILLSISIETGINSIDDSTDKQFKSELYIIQQAIYQKQIEYENKKDTTILVGEKIVRENKLGEVFRLISEFPEFEKAYEKIYNKKPEGTYYLIKNEVTTPTGINSFEELGVSGKRVEGSEFIVNYETGEVYNNIKKYYSNGITPMYLPGYNRDEITGELKSEVLEIVESN